MNYEFSLILKEGAEITEELADQLFEAGCDDGTPGVCCGVPVIGFSREADCLERRFPQGGNRLTFFADRWTASGEAELQIVELDAVVLQPRNGWTVSVGGSFAQDRIVTPPVEGDQQSAV